MSEWIGAGLVVLGAVQLFALMVLSGRVKRLEALLSAHDRGGREGQRDSSSGVAAGAGASDAAAGGAFAVFLAEDPSRESLPKKELFTAYRRWRREKGLNWSPP